MRHTLDHSAILDRAATHDATPFDDRLFASGLDVARSAAAGDVLVGQRRCESWHLDRDGRFVCGTRGTVLDSLANWANDPRRLVDAFLNGRSAGACSPTWVVVDERLAQSFEDAHPPGELDVEHFMRLRRQLDVAGITLVDAVIFDDQRHWWSINELLTGQMQWATRKAAA